MHSSLPKTKNLPQKHLSSKRKISNASNNNNCSESDAFEGYSSEEDSLKEETSSEITLEEQNTSEKESSKKERLDKTGLEKDPKRFLTNSNDSTSSLNLLDQTTLFLAIPQESHQLDKNRKEILRLLGKNPMNWRHRYDKLNPLEHAIIHSDLSVIRYLLRFNPPRSIMHEALIQAF
jgi:hypothetical protein